LQHAVRQQHFFGDSAHHADSEPRCMQAVLCRAFMAHVSQSRPESGPGCQDLGMCQVVPSSLGKELDLAARGAPAAFPRGHHTARGWRSASGAVAPNQPLKYSVQRAQVYQKTLTSTKRQRKNGFIASLDAIRQSSRQIGEPKKTEAEQDLAARGAPAAFPRGPRTVRVWRSAICPPALRLRIGGQGLRVEG